MSDPSEPDVLASKRSIRQIFRKPRPSVRLRLTVLYGGLFVVAGAGLVTVTNVLYRAFSPARFSVEVPAILRLLQGATPPKQLPRSAVFGRAVANFQRVTPGAHPDHSAATPWIVIGGHTNFTTNALHAQGAASPSQAQSALGASFRQLAGNIVRVNAFVQQRTDAHGVLIWSVVGFVVMSVAAIVLAWWLSGRALRPLRDISAAANTISATNLHERLDLAGPDDELKQLTDTFNRLLGRLEVAFDAQRRFVANASHELRTPLARQRAVAEVALSDPDATIESLRASYQRVIAAGEDQERLIAALLVLARSDRGLASTSPVDVDEIIRRSVASFRADAEARRLRVETTLHASPFAGDPELVERLVVNLVANAVEHNVEDGFVRVTSTTGEGGTQLSVVNSGRVVDPDDVERLMRPFERADGARLNHNGRFGLGLSIVEAIASAHGGALRVIARAEGGFAVAVEFSAQREGETQDSATD